MTHRLPTLLVIRHGETQWNVAGRLQGRRDSPLTANGARQALAVGSRLEEVTCEIRNALYWVSPLGRARQTASILADSWTIPFDQFVEEPLLAERSYGVWEGMTKSEIELRLPKQFSAHQANPWNYKIHDGESRIALTSRMSSWLEDLDPSLPHVIVTHSGCLRALRGIYSKDTQAAILQYREAQTSSFLLSAESCEQLDVSASILGLFGCSGSGGTVWI
jgi:broad specificity phosphatase PhoE